MQPGGKFSYRMEAIAGQEGFDFSGTYAEITPNESICYTLDDGRKVSLSLKAHSYETHVSISFDPEAENSIKLQRAGWQAILDNFKKYTEKQ